MIPKIIHQTWISEELPENFKLLRDSWRLLHPDWEYRLWTDQANRQLIADHYPEFLARYDGYPQPIQRVDAARYFILRKYGGVYVDLDFQCFQNVSPLLDECNFVLGKEPGQHAERFGREMILCNAFMASCPDNDFLHEVCRHLADSPISSEQSFMEVLTSTGPFMLTDMFCKYPGKSAIKILEAEVLYPLTIHEVRSLGKGVEDPVLIAKLENAFGLHYFWGGW